MGKKHGWTFLIFSLLLGTSMLGILLVTPTAPAFPQSSPQAGQDCIDCHEERVASFQYNPHTGIETQGLASRVDAKDSCTSCHGDPTAHIDAGGGEGTIFAFKSSDIPLEKTRRCLNCHANNHPRFLMSPHAKGALDCTTCHSIHASDNEPQNTKKAVLIPKSKICSHCHADIFSKFNLNEHHRLREGILDCTSCHDPHEPVTRTNLGGFKQQACLRCHTDKQGPFVYEHGSVLIEGCTSCHDPHGSPNRHMLNFQRVTDLCFSCHTAVPGFHARFKPNTLCTNCHSTIHGSNLSPFFLR